MAMNNGTDTADQGTTAPGTGIDFMTTGANTVPDFSSFVPDSYKNPDGSYKAEWVTNASRTEKPVEAVFQKVDNLEKLIGARPAVPDANSTPEQKQAFYKALGVPDDIKGYTYQPPQYSEAEKPVGEILDKFREGPIFDAVKQAALDNGIPPQALQNVIQAYEKAQIAHAGEMILANNQAQEDMNAATQRIGEQFYGNKFTEVCRINGELLRANIQPQVMQLLERVPGEHLAVFAMALDGIRTKYIREDGSIKSDGTYAGGRGVDEITAEMSKIFADPDFGRYASPRSHELDNQLIGLREQLKRATGGQ